MVDPKGFMFFWPETLLKLTQNMYASAQTKPQVSAILEK